MKTFRTKSPQLAAFLRVRCPGVSISVCPVNPSRAEFIIEPADDQLYIEVGKFNDSGTTVPLSDFLHELANLRDRVRTTLRGGGVR